jgi:sugar/nucleoside kinase (ribokinase family)
MKSRSRPTYLILGHVTQDLTSKGVITGGTASYSGLVALALGCETLILTSAGPNFDPAESLPGITVNMIPASETTTFENIYTAEGRRQYIYKWANPIETEHIPHEWRQADIVHLGPLNQEFEPAIIHNFPNSLVGITPQGWLRKWDESGKIGYKSWPPDAAVLSRAAVVVISEEDIPPEESLQPYLDTVPLFVKTKGPDGCTVFHGGEAYHFQSPAVKEVNLTGAGDIFATAFLVQMHQSGSFFKAAEFANYIAAWSITGNTLAEKVSIIKEKIRDGDWVTR